MALLASAIGTPVIFLIAYLLERGPSHGLLGAGLRLAVTLPLAIPGLVLGLCILDRSKLILKTLRPAAVDLLRKARRPRLR
jgi:ABC-type Fe3+ transport system permease subunit